MAGLPNDIGTLRLRVDLVDREAPVRGPIAVVPEGGRAPAGRLLCAAAVEYLDRRDGEWWPLAGLPVLYVAPEEFRSLADELEALLRGTLPGFAWRCGEGGALGLQLGTAAGPSGDGLVVEVGIDLSLFLAEAGQAPPRPGAELALFRFFSTRAAAVAFTDALRREGDDLLARD
jgi:hypothetical protein